MNNCLLTVNIQIRSNRGDRKEKNFVFNSFSKYVWKNGLLTSVLINKLKVIVFKCNLFIAFTYNPFLEFFNIFIDFQRPNE